MNLEQLFQLMADKRASDLYLSVGAPVTIRINGVCVPINQECLSPAALVELLSARLSAAQFQTLEATRELNIGLVLPEIGNFRLSVFMQRGSVACVVRYIPSVIPGLDELLLPEALRKMAMERRGLILIAGAAGSGKSTTIASMLDHRNAVSTGHILTFEDPIEFVFTHRKSIVNQREIGSDSLNLDDALSNALRQAPDVLFIGEIRRPQTMSAALAYAMSGHLVVATLHATNSAHALNRVIGFYPPEVRVALFQDLATALKAIVSQRLVRSRKGGRVPAVEILMNAGHMSELVESGDVPAIKEAMEKSLAPESQTFEQSLHALLARGMIARDEALAAADSKNNLLWLINNGGGALRREKEEPAPVAASSSFSEFTLNI